MGLRDFLFGPKEEKSNVIGYEIDLGEIGPDDRPFAEIPTGTEVREQGAPSMFTDYSGYPGGYKQAVRDWRAGTYVAPEQEDIEPCDEIPEDATPEEIADKPEEKRPWWALW